MPHISGSDVAGEVVAAPAAMSDRPPRDAAARRQLRPLRGVPVGPRQRVPAVRGARLPESRGGYAEYVKVPVQNLVPIPDAIDFVQAAAFPLTFLTAWHMLMTRARLKRGEDVLVLAAGSGVGQAAIQIARPARRARVRHRRDRRRSWQRARALARPRSIHHHKQDIAEEIKRLTNRRGVDVVIEHVGEATWAKSVRALARGGRLVTCGATTGARRRDRPARAVREAAVDARIVHGDQGRAAARRALLLRRPADAGRSIGRFRCRRRCGAARMEAIGAVRQDRPRSADEPASALGVSLFTVDRGRQHRAGCGDDLAVPAPIRSPSRPPSTKARSRRWSRALGSVLYQRAGRILKYL